MGTYEGPRRDTAGSLQTFHARRLRTAVTTGHDWFESESIVFDADLSTSHIRGFVSNELETLSAGLDENPSDLRNIRNHEEPQRVENAALELPATLEALLETR